MDFLSNCFGSSAKTRLSFKTGLFLNYITTNHFKNYEISDYILSKNSELTLDNINILSPFIKINYTKISISFIPLILIILYLISLSIFKYKNIFVTKSQPKVALMKLIINRDDPFKKGESYRTRETVPLMEFINKFLNSISDMLLQPVKRFHLWN